MRKAKDIMEEAQKAPSSMLTLGVNNILTLILEVLLDIRDIEAKM